jgi:hypothetical protein
LVYNENTWQIYGGWLETGQTDSEAVKHRLIHQSGRVVKAAAWLIHNRLYFPGLRLRIRPRPGPVSLEALLKLIETINTVFSENREDRPVDRGWHQGGAGPRLLVVNMEDPWYSQKIMSVDILYKTAWGEMRHTTKNVGAMPSEAEKIVAIGAHLLGTGELKYDDIRFFVPNDTTGGKLERNLGAALSQIVIGKSRPGSQASSSRLKLDIS